MKRAKISEVFKVGTELGEVEICGWVRTFRNNQFIALNDGSTLANLQLVLDRENTSEEILKNITTGAALKAIGQVVVSQGKGQQFEIDVKSIDVVGLSDAEKYPLQPKRHSLEFLRDIAHLRFRTNTFSAIFRIRHAVSFAIHEFFNKEGFYYLHSPIITGSDAEGAGEMFQVTTLDLNDPARTEEGNID